MKPITIISIGGNALIPKGEKGTIDEQFRNTLLAMGKVVAGGGGVPVIEKSYGELKGVDAVIDKDLASAVLAKEIGAERFVNITSIDKVYIDFGKPNQRGMDYLSKDDAKKYLKYLDAGEFAPGSMGPKIEAAKR